MDYLENIQLGTYSSIWKSIAVFHEAIANTEKKNPDILRHLVTYHENYHWLQMNTSSLGHIISIIPFFQKNTVSIYYDLKKNNSQFKAIKPLMSNLYPENNMADKMLEGDISSIAIGTNFLYDSIKKEDWLACGKEINQGLFAIYDMYLMYSKHIIVKLHGKNKYNALVEKNKHFWDRDDNFALGFYEDDGPKVIGFRDLVECAARLVEIKYYKQIVKKYASIDVDAKINDEYLFNNQQYFKPLKYIEKIFAPDFAPQNMDSIFKFLSIAIHISINPPIVPFFDIAWQPIININDIHPGLRFIRLCRKVREIYGSCVDASKDTDFYIKICTEMAWHDDKSLYNSFQNSFSKFQKKISEFDDGKSSFPNESIQEMDLYLYRYGKYNSIKAKNTNYFINPVEFIGDEEKLSVAIYIDKHIHSPVYFDTEVNKFQVNLSGLVFEGVDEKGKMIEIHSTVKEKTDVIQQEFLNSIIIGIFDKLDKQLLHKKGAFDLSIFSQINAKGSIKNEILELYNKARSLELRLE